jgi:arylsulfatase A-like enzyme
MQLATSSAIAAGTGLSPSLALASDNSGARGRANRPNIILIITDQERSPQYWPPGWADANLPNRKRLADHGLTFTRAFCSTAMCSPSRATLFTGLYPAQHGVEHTLTTGGSLSPNEPTLQPTTQNMARLLASAGYNVQYRGKWHLTKDVTGITDASSADDLEKFGFHAWQPPDAGQDTNPAHFGGGCADYDQRWANQAADFLRSKEATSGQPFALIVSFVNPHDALAYANSWDQQVGNLQNGYCYNYLAQAPGCFQQGINLPPTLDEDLIPNHKPTAQAETLLLLAAGLGVLVDGTGPLAPDQQMNYVNFYAYLHKVVDQHIGTVVDALEANPALYNKTIVIRVSDHGEMGLSHGGLRQKLFNAYEETLRVPIVISNPKYFPKPVQTDALATLVDIMPTLATLAGVPNREQWNFKGRDLTPILADAIQHPTNPTASVQDSVLFTFDDDNPACPNPQRFVHEPNHIHCIRDRRYKYAVYFDPCGKEPPQHELYDLWNDSQEVNNLANPANVAYYNSTLVAQMEAKLESKMAETGTSFTPSSPYCA